MALDDTGYDGTADALGLTDDDAEESPSNFWGHLDGDDLGSAIIDRFTRFRQWQSSNGLLKGWRLKQCYYMSEYRADPEIPHLPIMQQFGSQNEFQWVTLNHLRSLIKTIMGSVIQNPPNFQCRAINSDADVMEAAALYQGVLDYYTRQLGLTKKINKCVELGMVIDQGFALVEWDPFAVDGEQPIGTNLWKGAPSVRVLTPWDVCYDPMQASWNDLDWLICRDWIDREKARTAFPEAADEIDASQSRTQIMQANLEYEGNTRYTMSSFPDLSNDVQLYKFYHKPQPWMPQGRFAMFTETGKMLYESPAGLVYPKLPVERFVCDDQIDTLLGYSPINELLSCQEAVNALMSSITSNAANYANQYIAAQQGTDLNPKTLSTGHTLLTYPPGAPPPQGLSLLAIPEPLFKHLEDLMKYMQEIPGVSNSSRGQTGGANQTGSAMAFLQGQTTANQGSMSDNYSQFAANVMTSLLHVLRVFGKTAKTIRIMGKNVASREIVLSETLQDFDAVVVDLTNPILNTPQGKMAMAQQMLQYGNLTPQQILQVATSGNLQAALEPGREELYYIESESEWLMNGDNVLVNALDNHQQHIQQHSQLFSTPWLRKPDLAQRLGITNAPAIMQNIMGHIQQHMGYMAGNQGAQTMTAAGAQPGAEPPPQHPALHGHPPPAPGGGAPPNSPAQGAAVQAGTGMPSQPKPPSMPAPGQGPPPGGGP